MVVVKGTGILCDAVKRPTQGRPCAAIGRMGMRGSIYIGPHCVYRRMNRKRCAIHRVVALHHATVVIDANHIGDFNLTEMNTKRVHPKGIRELGVARRNMSSHALIETKPREQPKGTCKSLLAVQSLFLERGKYWNSR